MINKIYKCSWCKKKLPGHPKCFDYKIYTGTYRGYQTKYHFYFCTECFNKIGKFVRENKITFDEVVHLDKR